MTSSRDNLAPIPLPVPSRNPDYPSFDQTELANGLKLLLLQDDRLPRFSIILGFPLGRIHDPDDNLSLSSLLGDMLQEGSSRRTSRQIAQELDQLAIRTLTTVTMEYSLVSLLVLEKSLEEGLEIVSDFSLRPTFPSEELEKMQVRWHSNLIAQRSDPAFLAPRADSPGALCRSSLSPRRCTGCPSRAHRSGGPAPAPPKAFCAPGSLSGAGRPQSNSTGWSNWSSATLPNGPDRSPIHL